MAPAMQGIKAAQRFNVVLQSPPMRRLQRSSNILRRSQAQIEATHVAHIHHHVTITEGDNDRGRASPRETALTMHKDRKVVLLNSAFFPVWLDHSLLEHILEFEDDTVPKKRRRTKAIVCSVYSPLAVSYPVERIILSSNGYRIGSPIWTHYSVLRVVPSMTRLPIQPPAATAEQLRRAPTTALRNVLAFNSSARTVSSRTTEPTRFTTSRSGAAISSLAHHFGN